MAGTGSSTQVDPIAYRTEEQGNIDTPVTELSTNWEFDPAKLDNADVNLSAYGDDSSEQNYNNPNLRGGENDKYRGENTRNTSIAYDPNATIEGLNPNYAYGQKAQMINSSNAGYIQRRNDQIASALYNAGKVSPEDVREFLMQQEGFMNSTENERENTIKSVWKRLGEIAGNNSSNRPQEENKPQPNEEAVNNMKDDLLKSTAGELYGKNTADINGEDRAIKTLEDANNVQRKVNEQRIRNMGYLQNMDSTSIAASIVSGYSPYGEQAMADLKKYDPTKYAEVQAEVKKMNAQTNINSIAKDGVTADSELAKQKITEQDNDLQSEAEARASDTMTSEQYLAELQSKVDDNSTAKSARDNMQEYSNQINQLKKKIKNLKREANSIFKSDVPQYIVNAYISNKTLEYQDQIEVLTSNLQAAAAIRSNEIEEIKLNMAIDQFQLSKENQAFNQWATRQNLNLAYEKFANDKLMNSLIKNEDGTYSQILFNENGEAYLSSIGGVTLDGEIYGDASSSLLQGLAQFCSTHPLGSVGGQCGSFVNDYLQSIGLKRIFGNELTQKESLINGRIEDGYVPQVGDIAIMDSPSSPEYGHVAIVTAVNGNQITTLESNKKGEGEIFTRTFIPSSSKYNSNHVYGYYHPTGVKSLGTAGQWTRKDGTSFDLNVSSYNSLNGTDRETVLGLLNLSINPSELSTRMGYSKGAAQKLQNAAMAINPDWSASDYGLAKQTKTDWTKSSKNGSNSRNATAVQTAKELYDMADTIGNTTFTDYNKFLNFLKRRVSAEKYVELSASIGTLAYEYAGALKGNASPTDQDVNDAKQQIAVSFSKGGMKSATKTMAKLLYNKNVTEAVNYSDYTYEKPPVPYITPDVQDWMQNIVGVNLSEYYNMRGNDKEKDPFTSLDN